MRAQYATLYIEIGTHFGNSTNSTGMNGVARHGTWPNVASRIRVNTFARAAPPSFRIASRARIMCGACSLSPAAFSAKYAFTLHDTSGSPSTYSAQPPWVSSRWFARR